LKTVLFLSVAMYRWSGTTAIYGNAAHQPARTNPCLHHRARAVGSACRWLYETGHNDALMTLCL
jgi:hypothetical protein